MTDYTTQPPMKYLCVKDVLSTDEGRPLQETRYEYDREGMVKHQYTTVYTTASNRAEPMAVRETQRDAYGILVRETLFGEDGRTYRFTPPVVYEKGRDGLLQRVTVLDEEGGGILYFLGYHGVFDHRRGLPQRVRSLAADGSLRQEHRYEYDRYAHLVSAYGRGDGDEAFTLACRREWKYDAHGRSIHLNVLAHDQPENQFVMNRYYDEHGRCTYAVFMQDPDFAKDKKTLIPGFFHDYEYREFSAAARAEP